MSISAEEMDHPIVNSSAEANIVVTVVIPIHNEEKYITQCLDTVLRQDYPKENIEINLVDGMSEDRTIELINPYMRNYTFIHVYQNPKKTVPYAMNIGIRNALGKYIVRLDAHAEYAADYISKCVEFLEKTDASNVGGPMMAVGKTNVQKAIAAAYHSQFAMGGAKCHKEDYEGYSDTVWLGAYKKAELLKVGLYDELFTRNQDDELNYRIIKNGGKIYITPQIKSVYYPRAKLKSLFKQYYEYGFWKTAVVRKHKVPARITHLIPVSFVIFIIVSGVGAIFNKYILLSLFLVLSLYIVLNLCFSLTNKFAENLKIKLYLFIVHIILHISYGWGFLVGIFIGPKPKDACL